MSVSIQKDRAARPHRTIPSVTVALMATAVVFTGLLLFTDIDEPHIGDSNAHFGAVFIFVPPVLFFLAGVAARMDSSISRQVGVNWAIVSAALGIVFIPAFWTLTVFLWGP